jgi:hypothetical protein
MAIQISSSLFHFHLTQRVMAEQKLADNASRHASNKAVNHDRLGRRCVSGSQLRLNSEAYEATFARRMRAIGYFRCVRLCHRIMTSDNVPECAAPPGFRADGLWSKPKTEKRAAAAEQVRGLIVANDVSRLLQAGLPSSDSLFALVRSSFRGRSPPGAFDLKLPVLFLEPG